MQDRYCGYGHGLESALAFVHYLCVDLGCADVGVAGQLGDGVEVGSVMAKIAAWRKRVRKFA